MASRARGDVGGGRSDAVGWLAADGRLPRSASSGAGHSDWERVESFLISMYFDCRQPWSPKPPAPPHATIRSSRAVLRIPRRRRRCRSLCILPPLIPLLPPVPLATPPPSWATLSLALHRQSSRFRRPRKHRYHHHMVNCIRPNIHLPWLYWRKAAAHHRSSRTRLDPRQSLRISQARVCP